MSGKGGLGGIPILPQNLLAVNEENPKVFKARICYIIVYLILLGLFIAYAVINLIEFLDAQKNPVLTASVAGESMLYYPVVAICSYDQGNTINPSDVSIDYCGSVERLGTPECSKGGGKSKSKPSKDDEEKKASCKNNYQTMTFPYFENNQPVDYSAYACVMVNLDTPFTEEISSSILNDDVCSGKAPTGGKGKGKGKNDDISQAYATGVGYQDRYTVSVESDSISIFSMVIKPSIEDFSIHDADDAGNGFPAGSLVAAFIRRTSFKCDGCGDDEVVYYYNSTLSILTLPDSSAKGKTVTTIQFYFDSITTYVLEEAVTTTTLDYLGNFAGMLGTLLGFAVINYVDRLLCLFMINHGGMSSVWDQPH